MISTNKPIRTGQGFSVIDSVIALTIICCLLSALVPLFSFGSRVDGRARRDAQELGSICYEAQRAGVNFVADGGVQPTIQNLLRGGQSPSGRAFKATGMTLMEAMAASQYLRVEAGALVVNLAPRS